MTNTEIIQAIRNEIERRLKVTEPYKNDDDSIVCARQELFWMRNFLSTLEKSERPEPYNPVYDEAYLNEKIKKATESWKGVDVDAMLAECRGYDEEKSEKPMQEGLEEEINDYIASHFHIRNDETLENGNDPLNTYDFADLARHFAQWGAEHAPLPEDTVLFNKGVEEGKRLMMEDFPKWKKIKAGEKLPCPAYVWTIAYDNYPDCFEGRLMPNMQGVKVGRDTWYLPVDVIHNLPKED